LVRQHSTDATADMSTSDEKVWQTTAIQNLVRYRSSGTYFARFRLGRKLVWKSLKTTTFSVAKQRLPDTMRDHRARLESFAAFADGKITVADAAEAYLHKVRASAFDKILALAGESLDGLFDSVHYLKPIADFRDEVAAALPRRAATQLIELCQVECSPRVSFETAETKTKER
jgi:hypothetical protein